MIANLPNAENLFGKLERKIAPHVSEETGIIGIHTGGVWLASRLHHAFGIKVPLGVIDVSFYRDDYAQRGLKSKVYPSSINFEVENRDIILVDDVLHSGRTVRAAINEIFDHGRPKKIMLGKTLYLLQLKSQLFLITCQKNLI